jgi:type II secretory pathway predicted ATPase ExeA
MFERQFGLRENPFVAGHQPRFVYPSREHQEALAHLRYGIENREPFVLITGEVGTGKTTALYDVLTEWQARVVVALITNSQLSRDELLEEICLRFGLATAPGSSKPQLLAQLERHLLAIRSRGDRAILLLDEAQNLHRDLLEEIRLLSNLEVQGEKLMQVFLIGQPELESTLARAELRQLRQRIAVHYRLNPLTEDDTERYIHHRLTVAGGHALTIFPAESCREVYRLSHGIPREINTVAAQAMLNAFVEDSHVVRPEHVRAVAKDTEFSSIFRGNDQPAPAASAAPAEPGTPAVGAPHSAPRLEPQGPASKPEARTSEFRMAPLPGVSATEPSRPNPPRMPPPPPEPFSRQGGQRLEEWKRQSQDEPRPAETAAPAPPAEPTARRVPPPLPPRAAAPESVAGSEPSPMVRYTQSVAARAPEAPSLSAPQAPAAVLGGAQTMSARLRERLPDTIMDVTPLQRRSNPLLTWLVAAGLVAAVVIAAVLALRFLPKRPETLASASAPASSGPASAGSGNVVTPAMTPPAVPPMVIDTARRDTAATAGVTQLPAPAPSDPVTPPEPPPAPPPVATAPPVAATAPPTRVESTKAWGIASGDFFDDGKAELLRQRLADAVGVPARIVELTDDGRPVYRVVVGEFTSRKLAEETASEMVVIGLAEETRVIPVTKRPKL